MREVAVCVLSMESAVCIAAVAVVACMANAVVHCSSSSSSRSHVE
jgi:hypothetical protein